MFNKKLRYFKQYSTTVVPNVKLMIQPKNNLSERLPYSQKVIIYNQKVRHTCIKIMLQLKIALFVNVQCEFRFVTDFFFFF